MASAISPDVALPLITHRIRRLITDRTGFRASYHERALMNIVTDLVDVVTQLHARLEATP